MSDVNPQEALVDQNRKCMATLVIGIVIQEPVQNGGWRAFHVNNDSLMIQLNGYNHQDLMGQVYEKLQELKQAWGPTVVSMENLQNNAGQITLRTEPSS